MLKIMCKKNFYNCTLKKFGYLNLWIYIENSACDSLNYTIDSPVHMVSVFMGHFYQNTKGYNTDYVSNNNKTTSSNTALRV